MIQVKGFCDSTGSAAQNQELSRDRAEAVIEYLEQEASVPMRYILAPGAMGTVEPVASNETAAGRAENRRVEVTVLLNRGVAGDQ
jgi:OOP family OmpA-OmpF porin